MTDQEAALRRLAGMLGPRAFERLGWHRRWMAELMTQLRFLEDVGFTLWAEGRPEHDGRVGWSFSCQRRILTLRFELDQASHRVIATFHQPTMGFDPSDGWSLGPALGLGPAFESTGTSTTGIEQCVAVWCSTIERNVALFDDALTDAERVDLAEANLERAAPPPKRPEMPDEVLKAQPWWWRRYRVQLVRDDGTSFTGAMVTNQGPTKALAWVMRRAEQAPKLRRPSGETIATPRMRQATITDEGPIDVDADGVAVLPDDADHDRMEF